MSNGETIDHGARIAALSYEQARDELVVVVNRLEAGGEPLEVALGLWEQGELLAQRCQDWLDVARARIDQVRSQSSTSTEE